MPAVMIRQLDGLPKVMAYTSTAEQRGLLLEQAEMILRVSEESVPEPLGSRATCAAATTPCCGQPRALTAAERPAGRAGSCASRERGVRHATCSGSALPSDRSARGRSARPLA